MLLVQPRQQPAVHASLEPIALQLVQPHLPLALDAPLEIIAQSLLALSNALLEHIVALRGQLHQELA